MVPKRLESNLKDVYVNQKGYNTLVYDNYDSNQVSKVKTSSLKCKKCLNNDFSICLKYEYPDVQELYEYKISDIGNAYTWVWITIKCNCCGSKYNKFIDLETG